jgi:uncharacterized protein YjbI with pentapeptide repeats
MAEGGSQQRKPNFRTAVEDVKTLATAVVMKLESVFGRRLWLRSPAVSFVIGVAVTVVLAVGAVMALLLTSGAKAVYDSAPLIAAVIALGGVLTAQLVTIALEAQRAQDRALQAFLDQISYSDAYRELRTAPASGHKRAILRAKIQTLLLQLDEKRKGVLLSFLHGAKLSRKEEITPYEYTKDISEWKGEERWKYPILRLDHVDFSRTKRTPDTELTFDDLRGIILRGAKLSGVNLSGANLRNADLRDADLSCAQLRKADEHDSEEIPGEYYNEYCKAIRGRSDSELLEIDSIVEIDLSKAKLSRANLSKANLNRANLNRANLSKANLSKANLRYADLSGADLRGAVGITNEELEQQAKSLKGATMPNGQKYEDWREDKEGSGKDV